MTSLAAEKVAAGEIMNPDSYFQDCMIMTNLEKLVVAEGVEGEIVMNTALLYQRSGFYTKDLNKNILTDDITLQIFHLKLFQFVHK